MIPHYYLAMPKVALVTGASKGIGRAIALRLAKDGFRVALNDIKAQEDALERVRDEISQPGNEAFAFIADISSEEGVRKMIDDVVKTMGSLDVVCLNIFSTSIYTNTTQMVANAGICIVKPFMESGCNFEFHFAMRPSKEWLQLLPKNFSESCQLTFLEHFFVTSMPGRR